MSTPTPTPAAWYELSAALSAAQAVSACALDSLPMSKIGNEQVLARQIDHLGNLIGGIQILLERCAGHMEELGGH